MVRHKNPPHCAINSIAVLLFHRYHVRNLEPPDLRENKNWYWCFFLFQSAYETTNIDLSAVLPAWVLDYCHNACLILLENQNLYPPSTLNSTVLSVQVSTTWSYHFWVPVVLGLTCFCGPALFHPQNPSVRTPTRSISGRHSRLLRLTSPSLRMHSGPVPRGRPVCIHG